MKSMKKFKFCFDLDGTICEHKGNDEEYIDLKPFPEAVETLKKLKSDGHYIMIYTARNMVTYNNNVGKVIANQAPIVLDWLKQYDVPYDELYFGKPVADFYVDDKGIKMIDWETFKQTLKEILE